MPPGPTLMDTGHEASVGRVVEELDHPCPSGRRFHRRQIEKRTQKVDPEHACRLRPEGGEHSCSLLTGHDHPQRPGVRHSGSQLGRCDLWLAGLLERNLAADQPSERRFQACPPGLEPIGQGISTTQERAVLPALAPPSGSHLLGRSSENVGTSRAGERPS